MRASDELFNDDGPGLLAALLCGALFFDDDEPPELEERMMEMDPVSFSNGFERVGETGPRLSDSEGAWCLEDSDALSSLDLNMRPLSMSSEPLPFSFPLKVSPVDRRLMMEMGSVKGDDCALVVFKKPEELAEALLFCGVEGTESLAGVAAVPALVLDGVLQTM